MFGARNRPMISVDTKVLSDLQTVKARIAELTTQMKTLANEAERYARAMSGVAGTSMGQFKTGSRPANFPQVMRPGEAAATRAGGVLLTPPGDREPPGGGGGGGGGRGGGGGARDPRVSAIELAVVLPQIARIIGGEVGNVINRERVTTRLAMAQTGTYGGQAQAQTWQRFLRGTPGNPTPGFTSTGDLYGGAATLAQLGLLGSTQGQLGAQAAQVMRQTGQMAVMGGTNFQGAAQMVAGFMSPQTVNALRQGMIGGRSINASPGGRFQAYGQNGLLEQIYGAYADRGVGSEAFFRNGLRPGSPLYQSLAASGMTEDQMTLISQYGIARAEGKSPAEVQKDLAKRYDDTGRQIDNFRQSISALVDVLTTSLVPVIKAVTSILKPLANGLQYAAQKLPGFQAALSGLILALLAAQAKLKFQAFFGGKGMAGGFAGAEEAGTGGLTQSLGAGIGGMFSTVGGALTRGAAEGTAGLGLGATLLSSGLMLAGGIGGSWLGRHIGGKGTGGKIGSVLGGAAGGAATGLALGALGGPFAPITSTGGAIVGGLIGGISGLFGDPWPKGDAVPSDADLLAHPPKPYSTPGGGPLPGAGNSANLNPDFVKRLQAMFAANPRLRINSGWRSHEEQAYLRWQLLTGKRTAAVAPVGQSRHETGLAADIGPPSEYAWLDKHAQEYGVANVGAQFGEAWHYEPVGAVSKAPTTTNTAPATTPATPAPAAKAKAVSPDVRAPTVVRGGAQAYQEATAIAGTTGGTQIGDAWSAESLPQPMPAGRQPLSSRQAANSIVIHRIEINLQIARATPEEAERTARYLGTILQDRSRLLALAKGGGG
jgi:hypothetical protein